MKFIFKVLVLVALIVMSKLEKEEENMLVASKPPVSVQKQKAPEYQSAIEDQNLIMQKAAEVKVQKASLQFN